MKRRIALISEHASPLNLLGGVDCGGQNVYVAQVATELARLGHDVDVFTRRDDPSLPEVVYWKGVRVVHVPAGPPIFVRKEDLFPYMDEFAAYLMRFIRWQKRPYDLVHANFWMSGYVAAEFKRATGTPFVVTFHALGRVRRLHQGSADGFSDHRFAVEDRVVAECDQVIPECPEDQSDLTRFYGVSASKMTMIPCGFDPDEFWPVPRAQARATLGIPHDDFVVLQVGRLVPRKGIDTVIEGFSLFHGISKRPARLLVVGGETADSSQDRSPELKRLREVAERWGVAQAVTFIGRRGRETLRYFYSAADVFATLPWYEPFGITPVEAMACGTPVIGSDVGGIRFTVSDGKTGFLVPARDAQALASRLGQLALDPELVERFRQDSIRRANAEFRWSRIASDVAQLYERVLSVRVDSRQFGRNSGERSIDDYA